MLTRVISIPTISSSHRSLSRRSQVRQQQHPPLYHPNCHKEDRSVPQNPLYQKAIMYIPAQPHQATQFNFFLQNFYLNKTMERISRHSSALSISLPTDPTTTSSSSATNRSTSTTPSTAPLCPPSPPNSSSSPSSSSSSSSSPPALTLDLKPIVLSERYAQSRAFTSLTPPTSNANRLMASMLRRDSIELSLIRLNRAKSYY